jgi:hypothetical protein
MCGAAHPLQLENKLLSVKFAERRPFHRRRRSVHPISHLCIALAVIILPIGMANSARQMLSL